jgi:hypothetical protein
MCHNVVSCSPSLNTTRVFPGVHARTHTFLHLSGRSSRPDKPNFGYLTKHSVWIGSYFMPKQASFCCVALAGRINLTLDT